MRSLSRVSKQEPFVPSTINLKMDQNDFLNLYGSAALSAAADIADVADDANDGLKVDAVADRTAVQNIVDLVRRLLAVGLGKCYLPSAAPLPFV